MDSPMDCGPRTEELEDEVFQEPHDPEVLDLEAEGDLGDSDQDQSDMEVTEQVPSAASSWADDRLPERHSPPVIPAYAEESLDDEIVIEDSEAEEEGDA